MAIIGKVPQHISKRGYRGILNLSADLQTGLHTAEGYVRELISMVQSVSTYLLASTTRTVTISWG